MSLWANWTLLAQWAPATPGALTTGPHLSPPSVPLRFPPSSVPLPPQIRRGSYVLPLTRAGVYFGAKKPRNIPEGSGRLQDGRHASRLGTDAGDPLHS